MSGEAPTSKGRGGDPAGSPPRYAGIRTFARQRHSPDPARADVAIVGVPFDFGTSFRTGARFGPEAIRSASVLLREHHPVLDVDVFGPDARLDVVDVGDAVTSPGNAERGIGEIAEQLTTIAATGIATLVLGGDHSIVLGELRALAARHGPLALVLLDSHPDTWDEYRGQRYFHGTPFRRAAEEGLVLPERSLMAGIRGPLYSRRDLAEARDLGFEVIPFEELREMEPGEYGDQVRRRLEGAPAFLSFDIDFVDPAFAPATGTPEVGGPSSGEALRFVRSLHGIDFRGYDVVEVSPPYDGPGQATALLAANVAYEMLALRALARPA